MSVTRIGRWVCPRCGKVVETGHTSNHDYPDTPKGWRTLTVPQNTTYEKTDDVCPECYAAYLAFWRDVPPTSEK